MIFLGVYGERPALVALKGVLYDNGIRAEQGEGACHNGVCVGGVASKVFIRGSSESTVDGPRRPWTQH